MKTRDQLQTVEVAYAEICQGEDPWVALGNFMNDWFDHAKDQRDRLVAESLMQPDAPNAHTRRWAAFCAASVDWLCQQYSVPCPVWVHDPSYCLLQPWFYYPQARLHERLMQQTPEPFKRRNIYCGNRMFLNKYELAEQMR